MKIHYVSGSRADFGLMARVLSEVHSSVQHQLGIIVTSQHTNSSYGETWRDIEATGLPIIHKIPVELSGKDGAQMSLALASELKGFTEFWSVHRPDLVLLLGDRGEMLAAALAAMHLGIHIGHIHGGERSGTLDESFRHAISKIAHYHFTATPQASERLARMGELRENIHYIGAPGLVALNQKRDREWLQKGFSISHDAKASLVIFHPVVQQAEVAAHQFNSVMEAVSDSGFEALVMRPNSDAGGAAIENEMKAWATRANVTILTHLARADFCRVMASVDLMIGNSSSGIIESASLAIPCVNVGDRQNGRERNGNTIDCDVVEPAALKRAIADAESLTPTSTNIYGTGDTHERFLEVLEKIDLSPWTLDKINTY